MDYASNTITPTYPDGLDVEIFKFLLLNLKALFLTQSQNMIEHVTPYIKRKCVNKFNF